METTERYDVVIVGGGAAGLSAALVLGRARRRVLVIDSGAPRNAPAAHMQGFLSRDGLAPSELLAIGRDEIAGYGVERVEEASVGRLAGEGQVQVVAEAGTFAALVGMAPEERVEAHRIGVASHLAANLVLEIGR